jgi:hypothetical protein
VAVAEAEERVRTEKKRKAEAENRSLRQLFRAKVFGDQ